MTTTKIKYKDVFIFILAQVIEFLFLKKADSAMKKGNSEIGFEQDILFKSVSRAADERFWLSLVLFFTQSFSDVKSFVADLI